MADTRGSRSQFLQLPAEIRLTVYRDLFGEATFSLKRGFYCSPFAHWKDKTTPNTLATCRKIRDEALPVLSAATSLNAGSSPLSFDALEKVPACYCASITRLLVDRVPQYSGLDIEGMLALLPSLQMMTIRRFSWLEYPYGPDMSFILSEAGDSLIIARAKGEIERCLPDIKDVVIRANHRVKLDMILMMNYTIRSPDTPRTSDQDLDTLISMDDWTVLKKCDVYGDCGPCEIHRRC